ncbi:MAG: hypothetical protein ACOY4O_16875 [Pseudomonadota bacterium]
MRTFFGMILGAVLTVALVYVYDSGNKASDANAKTIVNWDVAAADWQTLKSRTRQTWNKLTNEVDKLDTRG